MKTRYSWETDEEQQWDDLTELSSAIRPRRTNRLTFFLLVGLTFAAFAAIFILIDRRRQAQEEIVIRDVMAAHRTWEQAVAGQDLELFTSLLSREDARWFQTQRRLLMSGRAVERAAFGLELSPSTAQPSATQTPEIELDPNWRRAELSLLQDYALVPPDGPARTITLRQTLFYEVRGNRWLRAQPTESFWGDIQTGETSRLTLVYPDRDQDIVERLAGDLDRDIDALCAAWATEGNRSSGECASDWRVPVEFNTDPESLIALSGSTTPAMNGRAFVLPTPSLVGLPLDDAGYGALYRGYTTRILQTLRNNLELPTPLPDQEVAALCFPSMEDGMSLYTFNPAADTWTYQPTGERYRYLQPLPDDSGLVLRGGVPGTDVGHLQLALRRAEEELPLFDEGTTEFTARLVGIPDRSGDETLLLSTTQGSTGLTSYRMLPLDSCADESCDVTDLAGFPLWSPDGERSLILTRDELQLGDAEGVPVQSVGRAFSPFWLTNDTFGFVRLLGGADERPEMELVLQSAASGFERPLFKSADLMRRIDLGRIGTVRIKYVAADPIDPNVLFLAATPVSAGSGVRFYVLKLRLTRDVAPLSADTTLAAVDVLLGLDDLPVGDPSVLTPTGYPPFSITDDGRWLVATRFVDPVTNTWTIDLYDIEHEKAQSYSFNYPAYPIPFPFYDWSEDGQWLLVVDNGFLRLIAPAYHYERIITHDFAACRYPAWVDK